jgi:hypothetical protein
MTLPHHTTPVLVACPECDCPVVRVVVDKAGRFLWFWCARGHGFGDEGER